MKKIKDLKLKGLKSRLVIIDEFRDHDRRANIHAAIANLMEALEIPEKEINKLSNKIQLKEIEYRKH